MTNRLAMWAGILGLASSSALMGQVPPPPLPPPGGGPEGPMEEGVEPPVRHIRGPRRNNTYKAETLTDEQVAKSVEKGVDYLLAQLPKLLEDAPPKPQGRFAVEGAIPFKKGASYLTIYTLLYAGQETGDDRLRFNSEKMKPAVEFILKLDEKPRTYEQALQACALAQLPEKPEYRRVLAQVRDQLIAGMGKEGGYTYALTNERNQVRLGGPQRIGFGDHSNAQYGLYGVWAAASAGVEVPMNYWRLSDQYWRKVQLNDGGWSYVGGMGRSSITMTAAGVASLYVTDEYLNVASRLEPRKDVAMEAGLNRLITTFDADSGNLYYMYSLERVGLASGLKFFGETNWFRAGAATIMNLQQPDGSFVGSYGTQVSTSYSVLFLLRGRAPVVMNKLQHRGNWNNRGRDSANLANFYKKKLERHVNWQVVPLNVSHEEWLDAPVLLITGNRDPKFTDEELENLRKFVHAGGLIFSSADGSRELFTEAMKKYANKLAHGRYEMRPLPPEHPLLNMYAKIPRPTGYWGLSNGSREWWVHSSGDMPATWHGRAVTKQEAYDFPLNLYWYATGKRPLRNKLQPLTVGTAKEITQKVTMARLDYPGNSDPEPGAWPRFAKVAAAQFGTEVVMDFVRADRLDPQKYPLTHMTGTAKVTLPERDVVAIKTYVMNGGTLFVDACGGDQAFSNSVRGMIMGMFPDASLDPLPEDHPIYKGDFSPRATPAQAVEYRRFWIEKNFRKEKPSLYAIMKDKRPVVIFSEFDVTSGLVGTETWGISGYTPASAQALARNVLLYVNGQK